MLAAWRQSGEHVGEPHPPGVVEMQGELQIGPTASHFSAQIQYLLGMRHTGGIGERYAVGAELDVALHELHHPAGLLFAFEGATERSGQRASHGDAGSLELAHDFSESFE